MEAVEEPSGNRWQSGWVSSFMITDIIRNVVKETGLREKYVNITVNLPLPLVIVLPILLLIWTDEQKSPVFVYSGRRETRSSVSSLKEKSCVIVGSCADYILKDREDCLSVFLYADEETKEQRIREIYGEVLLKEKIRVQEMDVRRGLNYQFFTGQEWGKAQNYDLALNRGSLGIEKCVELIIEAAK